MLWTRAATLNTLPLVPDYCSASRPRSPESRCWRGNTRGARSLQQVSLLVTLAGFILMLFGRRVFRLTWVPLLYLLLAMPIWDSCSAGFGLQVKCSRAELPSACPSIGSASCPGRNPDRLAESHTGRPSTMQRRQSAHGDRGDDLAGGVSVARELRAASDAGRYCCCCRLFEHKAFESPSLVSSRHRGWATATWATCTCLKVLRCPPRLHADLRMPGPSGTREADKSATAPGSRTVTSSGDVERTVGGSG